MSRSGQAGPGPRPARCRLPLRALAAGAALGLVACAGPRPWDVDPARQPRFEETRRTCHQLTDGEGGAVRAEPFEACMARRGFHRKPWWKFWN